MPRRATPSRSSRSPIDGWSGTTAPLAPNVEETLGADDYVSAFYRDAGRGRAAVDLFLSYYASQTARQRHPLAGGLPARRRLGGRADRGRSTVTLPGTRCGSFRLNRAMIQKGLERQLVYYWFEGRGRQITNDFAAKFHTAGRRR